ncbi:hypothetical protein JNM87_01765 [Candidatus Saccharibacteria bacterium]|nr:hypothetical protein [Candidatus Saccharibacteria bacterium]
MTTQSNLAGDFKAVQTAARKAKLTPMVGNIVDTANQIAAVLSRRNEVLSFINFTNVGSYLLSETAGRTPDAHCLVGRTVLAQILAKLPVADDAVIVDSCIGLVPTLYDPQGYIQAFR